MQYKSGVERDLGKIGHELGVTNVLEGSVRRSGNRVRVNAHLVDARNHRQLWGQTYDRDVADFFAIQSQIAMATADALHAKLSPNEKSEIERPQRTTSAPSLSTPAPCSFSHIGFNLTRNRICCRRRSLNEVGRA